MKVLPLDELQPGMEVAGDVRNFNRALLLARGTLLTSHHLRTLRMWGIDAVPVTGEDEPTDDGGQPSSAFTPEILAAAEAEVNLRLQHVPVDAPLMERLRRLAIQRAALGRAGSPRAPDAAGP